MSTRAGIIVVVLFAAGVVSTAKVAAQPKPLAAWMSPG